MVTPQWVNTRIQPIAVRDVLRYLAGSATLQAEVSRRSDIGGPDVLTYAEMMRRYAEVAGLTPRLIVQVPLLTPRLSSLWVGLVTPVPANLARPLVESLRNEVVCSQHDVAEYIPDPPGGLLPLEQAITLALQYTREGAVSTRWSSAATPGAPQRPAADRSVVGWRVPVRRCAQQRRARLTRDAVAGDRGHWRRDGVVFLPGCMGCPQAGCSTSWRAELDCAAAAATPGICSLATPLISGGWRRSSRESCCGCARR